MHPELTEGAAPAAAGGTQGHPDAITVTGLRKSYGSVQAVRDVSFCVRSGEIVALLGPNGAGKTTTLEILEGFRARDAGTVAVLGLDPGAKAAAHELRERTGLVLQDIAVEPYLTVRETIARQAGYYQAPRTVPEVIGLVGLAGLERRKVRSLSGGQKRRLDLALGLIGDPELLYLDEPTTGFDPAARRGAWDLVRALRASGTTILLTTHDMAEAQALADRVVLLSNGAVVAEGPPAWAYFIGLLAHCVLVSLADIALIVGVGRLDGVPFPSNWPAIALTLVLGAASFCALGVAVASVISNAEAAPAVAQLVLFPLLFLSGTYTPINIALLTRVTGWLPVRPFNEALTGPLARHTGADWRHLAVLAAWGAAGALVAVRCFRWDPRPE